MHRIEDILRQLNTNSATIQPELAAHLQQIQQRLDVAHAAAPPRPNHAATPESEVGQVALAAATSNASAFETASNSNVGTKSDIRHSKAGTRHFDSPSVKPNSAKLQDTDLRDTYSQDTDFQDTGLKNFGQTMVITVEAPQLVIAPTEEKPNRVHEPATPHFSRRSATLPCDEPAPDVTESPEESVIVKLGTATTQEAEPQLPLFESLWFRQAAPTTYIAKIVDRLLNKLPSTVPAVLHFCTDALSQAPGPLVTTQVAWELSRRNLGDVLLVDADYSNREVSRQLGNAYLPGLSECINLGEPLESLVRPTGVEHLQWIPSGSGDISFRRIAGGRWAEISVQLRRRFQWVCVHAGAAQDRVTSTWGRFCDFSFLITSMEDDLGQPTQQVVNHLRKVECRLSGLITID